MESIFGHLILSRGPALDVVDIPRLTPLKKILCVLLQSL